MKVVKCTAGHYFDCDTYDVCPICGEEIESSSDQKDGRDVSSKQNGLSESGLFKRFFARDTHSDTIGSTKDNETEGYVETQNKDSGNESTDYENGMQGPVDMDKTEAFYYEDDSIANKDTIVNEEHINLSNADSKGSRSNYNIESGAIYVQSPEKETLQEAIQQISASDDGKTMSFFSATIESRNKQIANLDPVVGWLIAISGNHIGQSFVINAGMNSIGRSGSNHIVIDKDGSVSRERHAYIIYEPKMKEFYVKPGESSGLTYVNDEYVTVTKMISQRDVLEIGNSRFIFVPLCGEDFSWENYIAKE